MAKLGKSLFALAAIGAAAAGTYYFLKKNENIPANMEDDEDFDCDIDVDGEEAAAPKRSYVNLDFNTVEEKAKDLAGKAAGFATKAGDSIQNFFSQAEGKVEEFFDDRKNAASDAIDAAGEAVAEAGDAVDEAVDEVKEEIADAVSDITE